MTTEPLDRTPSPFRDRKKAVVAVAVLALITGALETVTIVSIVAFIDGVTNNDLVWEIQVGPIDIALSRLQLGAIAGTSLVAGAAGQLASGYLRARAVAGYQYQMVMVAVRSYLATDWATQSDESSGSLQNLMTLCNGSASGLQGLMNLLSASGAVLMFTVAAFFASPLAAALLLFTGVCAMLGLRPIRRASREATRDATLAQREVSVQLGSMHELAQEIRVHNVARVIEQGIQVDAWTARAKRMRSAVLGNAGQVLYRFIALSFVLVGAIVASSFEDIDVARVGVAGLLLLRSLGYGQGIQSAWQAIENNKPYLEQIGETLATFEQGTTTRSAEKTAQLGDIELVGVSYSYDEDQPALREINLAIKPGETLGIVGPSGSGKSTLAQVLLGLREPSSGTYSAGGITAASINRGDWSRRVTVVPQQPRLLTGTVLENIRFHREWVDADAAVQAATAAGLHGEISELRAGYETVIGGADRDLSGGQRQRLGIARALAGKPDLLVLDEPTSALDAISEERIQETLIGLKGRVTVVIIAHRLATLNHCDRILVLEAGRAVALGTPDVVLTQNDFYNQAVRMQLVTASDTEPSVD